MAVANSSGDSGEYFEWHTQQLYHLTNTPLPRKWNPKDKYSNLRLTNSNLRVLYNGQGKHSNKDAGSVRADHPIPPACGIYYFEVTIINRGRDGFFGIGVSRDTVNLNRLPGWDHGSFGYHADDGHAFSASASGQPYGPMYTTGDVVGCGVNFLDNTCFYTKNGVCLGTAFTDIPNQVHPVVGLQTAGEELEANFGHRPFVYDIKSHIVDAKARLMNQAMATKLSADAAHGGEWQATMQKLVCSYLVHRGYSSAADCFSRAAQQPLDEDLQGIRHRQRILRLVTAGRLSEAIEATDRLYPGLLAERPHLLFQLKCRQFVEMVSGADSEVRNICSGSGSPHPAARTARRVSSSSPLRTTKIGLLQQQHCSSVLGSAAASLDVEMLVTSESQGDEDIDEEEEENGHGLHAANGHQSNGVYHQEDMDCSESQSGPVECVDTTDHNSLLMERILAFGRDLHALSVQLRRQRLYEERQRNQLRDAFSLLAYSSPAASPVGHLLQPSQREPVASALNSAILDSQHLPQCPALEVNVAHCHRNLSTLATSSGNCGACAFLDLRELGMLSSSSSSRSVLQTPQTSAPSKF